MAVNKKHIQQRTLPAEIPGCLQTLPKLIAKILAARNITNQSELDTTLNALTSFELLSGMNAAIELLLDAYKTQKHIMIIGDYDADGATSTAVAMRALKQLGYTNISYLVPNRFEFGYGLSPELVEYATASQPDIIITVDNGIACIKGVEKARALGMQVIITDHHLPGDTLPDANAIVNPNLRNDTFPFKSTAGVGVIFYVMLALRARMRELEMFSDNKPEPNLANLLDLVALGTVADVVGLEHNNRIFVAQGLARMRANQTVPGIRALINLSGRNQHSITASDLGFFIAPRLNAAGRLDDMTIGIECLLEDDPDRAFQLAEQLDQFNRSRKTIELEMQRTANSIIETLHVDESDIHSAYSLFDRDWHEGVIGILASRVKDKLHRPVIAFAASTDGVLKGSGRSIKGLHLRDILGRIDRRNPDLIIKFGGHAMAAGLTIQEKSLNAFREAFVEEVTADLGAETLQNVLYTDGELAASEISIESAELIQQYGPWGQAFPEPVFNGVFDVYAARIVAEKHVKFVLKYPQQDKMYDAIAFNVDDDILANQPDKIHAAYRLDINEFRGNRTAQLILEYFEPL